MGCGDIKERMTMVSWVVAEFFFRLTHLFAELPVPPLDLCMTWHCSATTPPWVKSLTLPLSACVCSKKPMWRLSSVKLLYFEKTRYWATTDLATPLSSLATTLFKTCSLLVQHKVSEVSFSPWQHLYCCKLLIMCMHPRWPCVDLARWSFGPRFTYKQHCLTESCTNCSIALMHLFDLYCTFTVLESNWIRWPYCNNFWLKRSK